MNKLKSFLLIISFLLTGCKTEHNERGYVIDKKHNEPFTTIFTTFIYTGKSMIPILHTLYHPESWSLDLRDEVAGNYEYYTVYIKDNNIWEEIKIGDYFIWNEDLCFDCEPTTQGD